MKKKRNLNLLLIGIFFVGIGFIFHSCLSDFLSIYPNKGVSFGYFSNTIIILSCLILVSVWVFSFLKINFYLMVVAIGGTINLVDRIFFGYVRDYWTFFWVYNNLADWIIAVGVIGFMYDLWKKK